MNKIRIWDIPVRLFHWTLVVLVTVSCYTGLTGGFEEMDYHMKSGYAILTLVTFRVLWGIFGSYYARFATFVRGPGAVTSHVRALLKGKLVPHAGHNPLGALSVLSLLLVLLVQAGTGLFANDEIFTEGPLANLVSYDTSRTLTSIHKTNYWVIAGLVGLHVLAIAFYELANGERLLLPMITGKKRVEGQAPTVNLIWELGLALVLLGICAAAVYAAITYL